nr:hypothetical protein GCM10020063_025770 [Dactylosporangium thailandense]
MPVSAAECMVSAHRAADPVRSAATAFATAIARFAPAATTTVRVLLLSLSAMHPSIPARTVLTRFEPG